MAVFPDWSEFGEPWAAAAFSREPQKGQRLSGPGRPLASLEYGLGTSRPGRSEHQPGGGVSGEKNYTEAKLRWGTRRKGLQSASASNLSVGDGALTEIHVSVIGGG